MSSITSRFVQVDAVYQPVISFRSGSVIGWEACVRGRRGVIFQTP
jgi:sensor c-di-GMP phosphodiesterase-like protein